MAPGGISKFTPGKITTATVGTPPKPKAGPGKLGQHRVRVTPPVVPRPRTNADADLRIQPGPLDLKDAKQLDQPTILLPASDRAKREMKAAGPKLAEGTRLMGSDELIERAGRKSGKTGKRLRPPSLSRFKRKDVYGKAGTALDTYRNKIATTYVSLPGAARREQMAELYGHLAKVERAIDTHQKQNKELPKKEKKAWEELKSQVARERELLGEIDDGKDLGRHRGASMLTFKEMVELKHVGMPLSAVEDILTFNEREESSSKVLGTGSFNTAYKIDYKYTYLPMKVFKPVVSRDPAPGEAAVNIGIPRDSPRYANRNVATSLVDQALKLNLIPKTNFARHDDQLGFVMDMVEGESPNDFDTRNPVAFDKSEPSGIQKREEYLRRGLYTPGQFREELNNQGFVINKDGNWEKQASIADQFDTRAGVLMNELSNLEWLDKITGQVDRHVGNYIVQLGKTATSRPTDFILDVPADFVLDIKGIDNDFSFGASHVDPAKAFGRFDIEGLPRLVDSSTAKAIEKMAGEWDKAGGMKERLSELLTDDEVAATATRLSRLRDHLDDLEKGGYVVEQLHWSTWRHPETGKSAHDILMADEQGSYIRALADEGARARSHKSS